MEAMPVLIVGGVLPLLASIAALIKAHAAKVELENLKVTQVVHGKQIDYLANGGGDKKIDARLEHWNYLATEEVPVVPEPVSPPPTKKVYKSLNPREEPSAPVARTPRKPKAE